MSTAIRDNAKLQQRGKGPSTKKQGIGKPDKDAKATNTTPAKPLQHKKTTSQAQGPRWNYTKPHSNSPSIEELNDARANKKETAGNKNPIPVGGKHSTHSNKETKVNERPAKKPQTPKTQTQTERSDTSFQNSHSTADASENDNLGPGPSSINNADSEYGRPGVENKPSLPSPNHVIKVKSPDPTAPDEYVEPPAKVAIDFGTIYSGCGFRIHNSRDLNETICMADRSGKLQSPRVPTVILLNKDGSFNSFGSEARTIYGAMKPNERLNCHYVEHFKMALYRLPRINRAAKIKDYQNRDMKAIDVFTESIRYFYKIASDAVKQSAPTINTDEIEWILTIPAIWTDSAKQFMKEAAIGAGIKTECLQLVLEPEAASFLFQETRLSLPEGQKYILADLGGGTADICAHEILNDAHIRELYRAIGGDYGGYAVTKAYISFLSDLFTENVWIGFTEKYPRQFFDMIDEFERKKVTFHEEKSKTITVKIEYALLYMFKESFKTTLTGRIKQSQFGNDLIYDEITGELVIKEKRIETFFRASVEGILAEIRTIIGACQDTNLKTIVLTGGFAESPYVRHRIRNKFNDMTVILNEHARMAVLKGAIRMGFKTTLTIERRARFTYGFHHRVLFKPGEHPECLKRERDGKQMCEYVFDKIFDVGELLERGKVFIRRGYNTARDKDLKHKDRCTTLWRSSRPDPKYCINERGQEDCEAVGKIVVQCPAGGWPDTLQVEERLIVNETEFKVVAKNLDTGEEYTTNLEFL